MSTRFDLFWRGGRRLGYHEGMAGYPPRKGSFAEDAEAIWRAALAAVDPWRLVRESVVREGDVVRIKGQEFDLAAHERVFVVSFGKAASAMGEALAEILDERLTSGLAVVAGPVRRPAPGSSTSRPPIPSPTR